MQRESQDIPDAEHGTEAGLDFTAQELLQELGEYFKSERRLPGDLDLNQVAKHFGISTETARKKLYVLVKDGILKKVHVAGQHGKMLVFRKANG